MSTAIDSDMESQDKQVLYRARKYRSGLRLEVYSESRERWYNIGYYKNAIELEIRGFELHDDGKVTLRALKAP